jgi:Na+-driven multidrug efflux pump
METIQRQGTAPVGSLLLEYSLPAIGGFLASALYQFVDRILVGRGVGTEAMAAVTCAYPLTMLAVRAARRRDASSRMARAR